MATTKAPRGFAAMDPQRQREISALGGRAAHRSGNAHEFDSREAALAGAKSRAARQRRLAAAGAQAQQGGAPAEQADGRKAEDDRKE